MISSIRENSDKFKPISNFQTYDSATGKSGADSFEMITLISRGDKTAMHRCLRL